MGVPVPSEKDRRNLAYQICISTQVLTLFKVQTTFSVRVVVRGKTSGPIKAQKAAGKKRL